MDEFYAAVLAAIIAASATLVTAFLTQFLAERYRRFHEGSAIAAGFQGELVSYSSAFPKVVEMLSGLRRAIRDGERTRIALRTVERGVDRFYSEAVGKIGLLGPDLAERVIFIYSNLNAFRAALKVVTEHHADMADGELDGRIEFCLQSLERATTEMEATIPMLSARSSARFCIFCLS